MAKIYIVGDNFIGEHLYKYFKEKYSNNEVIYFTNNFDFRIIDNTNYMISKLNSLLDVNYIDILINTISNFEFIQSLFNKVKNINYYHQVLSKKNKILEEFIFNNSFNSSISYYCQLYGPGQSSDELLPSWINKALFGKPIQIKRNYLKNWVFILDFCKAIDLILQAGIDKEIYNISTNIEIADEEIIRMVLKKLGRSEDLLNVLMESKSSKTLNGKKIIKLGWTPSALDKGLLMTIKWYCLDFLGEQIKNVLDLTSIK